MALQNPAGLYTGGAVEIEQPNMGMYANLLAKKQAREEALNQYFTELGDKINTAGVRMQDLSGPQGGINDEIASWRQNWLANKDSIKRGGMAQQEHMAKLNQIIRKIDQSKTRAKTELEIGKAKFEGKYDPDDDDLNVLDKIGKSIYDPKSYKQDGVSEYGWQDLSPSVPEFDPKKQNEFWMAASRGLKPGKVYDESNMRIDKTTGKAFVPYREIYSADQIKKIADDAADLVKGDRSARKYYNKILDSPEMAPWKRLNDAYQSIYGKNAQVSTPEQAAQADMIIKASGVFDSGEQAITDQDAAFQRSLDRMIFNSGLIAGRSASGSKDSEGLNIIDAYGEIENKFGTQSTKAPWLSKGGERLRLRDLSPQTQQVILTQANKISGTVEADPNDPDKLKTVPFKQEDIFLEKDGDNIYISDEKTSKRIAPIDRTGTNVPAQFSVKEKRKVLSGGKNSTTTPQAQQQSEVYSRSELKSAGWTDDQINKAVKAGKIKLK